MPSLLKTGRIITGIGFSGLFVLQACARTWLIGRPGFPEFSQWTAFFLLNLACLVWLVTSITFFTNRARIAAFILGCLIFIISFLIGHLPQMIHKDAEGILWQLNAYKTLALAGGCWIIAVSFPGSPTWLNNKILIITGWVTMALWLIIAGISHIKFNGFVQDFIPDYIPAHAFWSYFTAIALLAGGIGLLIGPLRKWAALLTGLMILLWFFLLHIPRMAANPKDTSEWMGVFESFTFSGILFVLSALSRKQTA